ncbi:MAG: YibE/F family protein, partial [Candidatus Pacebacteria bacterium]|nr:YibE/F family protein [Candidatus Paceibacterota bacterium]
MIQITDTKTEILFPSSVESITQTLKAELLEGPNKGSVVTFDNDYIQLKEGQKFFINYFISSEEDTYYSVYEVDRRASIIGLMILFVMVIIVFSGKQGVRSLVALAGSILVILYVLVPTLISGFSPVLISIIVAIAILFFAIFFTHGFNKPSAVAFGGTVSAVVLTGLLAMLSIHLSHLTGFASDESVYLNFNTDGQLDFVGLLLAAIIIGAIGVLDDVGITQVAVVRELYATDRNLEKWRVYKKAMRVGREHVSALINTLVLAYTGAALPLLLLFSQSENAFGSIINREIFATEIVRTMVGSIGLVLAVPITTLLAVYTLEKYKNKEG